MGYTYKRATKDIDVVDTAFCDRCSRDIPMWADTNPEMGLEVSITGWYNGLIGAANLYPEGMTTKLLCHECGTFLLKEFFPDVLQ